MWHAKVELKSSVGARKIGDEMPEADAWPEHGVGHRNWHEDQGFIEWRGGGKPRRCAEVKAAPAPVDDDADQDELDGQVALVGMIDKLGKYVGREFERFGGVLESVINRLEAVEARAKPADPPPIPPVVAPPVVDHTTVVAPPVVDHTTHAHPPHVSHSEGSAPAQKPVHPPAKGGR